MGSVKKTIIQSLPTRDETCGEITYSTCVLNTIDQITQTDYTCTLLFLVPKNENNVEYCSKNITLQMIKKIKSALNQEKYENCKRQKLCNAVKFELVNPRNIPKHDGTTTKTTKKPSFMNPTTPQIKINEESV